MWGLGFLFLQPPRADKVAEIVDGSRRQGFNYEPVGGSNVAPPAQPHPPGVWAIDHSRVKVGSGQRSYKRAVDALQRWRHFGLPWAWVAGEDGCSAPPVKRGAGVGVVARSLFVWTCNPLQIVWADGDKKEQRLAKYEGLPDSGRRFSFAHGCLAGHQLKGEERFAIEWHKDDDSVWYEICTYSRPATPLAVLTYPLVRFYQAKFARDSMAAMAQQVAAGSHGGIA